MKLKKYMLSTLQNQTQTSNTHRINAGKYHSSKPIILLMTTVVTTSFGMINASKFVSLKDYIKAKDKSKRY